MKIKEIREKSKKGLENLLQKKRADLRKLRFDLISKKIKRTSEVKKTRKDIARILTLLHQKIKNL